MGDDMYTPDEWAPPPPEEPHDHKGHSEEKCVRCGWVMGHRPLNCMNDDTAHRFPSQEAEIERLRAERDEWQAEYHKAFSELGLAADEIERLRAAGDALATEMALLINEHMLLTNVLRGDVRIPAQRLREVEAWRKARRG